MSHLHHPEMTNPMVDTGDSRRGTVLTLSRRTEEEDLMMMAVVEADFSLDLIVEDSTVVVPEVEEAVLLAPIPELDASTVAALSTSSRTALSLTPTEMAKEVVEAAASEEASTATSVTKDPKEITAHQCDKFYVN